MKLVYLDSVNVSIQFLIIAPIFKLLCDSWIFFLKTRIIIISNAVK